MSWLKNFAPNAGSMGEFMNMLPKLGKLKDNVASAKGHGKSANGLVSATTQKNIDMSSKLLSVKISPQLIDPQKAEHLETSVTEAINDALIKENEALRGIIKDLKLDERV